MRALLATLLLLAGCAAQKPQAPAPDVSKEYRDGDVVVRLVIPHTTIKAADSVDVRLEAEAPENRQLRFPTLEGQLDDFLLSSSELSPARLGGEGRVEIDASYQLDPLKTGELSVPALAISHWGPGQTEQDAAKIETEPVKITVQSLFNEDEKAELRDIAEPESMPIPTWWWVVAAGSLLAVIGLAYWLWRRRNLKPAIPEPVTPPNQIAMAEIDALLAENLIEGGQYKLYFLKLSEILRRYIEARFGLRAPERTTEEFLQELRPTRSFSAEQKSLLRDFLTHADLVKFAEYQPTRESGDEAAAICRRFVRETAPAPPAIQTDTKPDQHASIQ